MKKNALKIAFLTAATLGTSAFPAEARVNVDLNIGAPPPVMVVPGPPPPRHPHRVYYDRRPEFLFTPRLGFAVSVGGPYDMIFYGNRYYVYDDGGWYSASAYDGPWMYIDYRRLPERIRRYRYEDIRRYRDDEYRRHRPDYRDDRRDYRDDRRDYRDDRRDDRRDYRDDRRDDRRDGDRDRWR
jgi:hypothetical protein